jgi:hypothetical protein
MELGNERVRGRVEALGVVEEPDQPGEPFERVGGARTPRLALDAAGPLAHVDRRRAARGPRRPPPAVGGPAHGGSEHPPEVERVRHRDGSGFWDYFPTIRMLKSLKRDRTRGRPASANRASSFHLRWGGLPAGVPMVAAEAVLEIVEPPQVAELYFWALQVTFTDRGRRYGGGHLGLQWHPQYPGSTAVNWGGYAASGGELSGSISALPSALGNLNTRDLAWEPGRRHRLTVTRGEAGWTGAVDGQPIRDLHAGGTELVDLMVWSEVFARCDDPPVVVRWSDLLARDETGAEHRPDRVTVTYQSVADGGCSNTDVVVGPEGRWVEQRTSTERTVAPGTTLRLS